MLCHGYELTEGMRARIEDAFGCKVLDLYSTGEFSEIACEAEARGGPWRGDTALAVATLSWAAPDALVAGCCNGRLVIIKAAAPIA
mgnify:CR=1 FL=1